MSKYDPLSRHLVNSTGDLPLEFARIEEILGFSLPRSARRYSAWWSNSGGSHVQSFAWMAAGYRTEDVNLEQETVRFVPERGGGFGEMKQITFDHEHQPQQPTPQRGEKTPARHPAWGVWKGLVTLDPNYDYTQPADPDWGKVYEK